MNTGDVYRALWRHKFFVLVLTAGLVAAAWFLTSRQQPIYESSTLIRVLQRVEDPTQVRGNDVLETGERLVQSYATIAETSNIADRVSGQLDGEIPASAVKVSAQPVRETELLSITARSPSRENAQLIANAVPRALQEFIRETGTLGEQVITAERAGLPSEPASPNLQLNLALALLLGLIFNGALALLIEVLGDRVHDADELERVTGQPVLTAVPVLQFTRPPALEPHEAAQERPRKVFGRATSG